MHAHYNYIRLYHLPCTFINVMTSAGSSLAGPDSKQLVQADY